LTLIFLGFRSSITAKAIASKIITPIPAQRIPNLKLRYTATKSITMIYKNLLLDLSSKNEALT